MGLGAVAVKLELSVYVGADAICCLGVGAAVVRIFCLVAVWVGAKGFVRDRDVSVGAVCVNRLVPMSLELSVL